MRINEKHKKVVEERGYIYIFTYEKDDITLDKKYHLSFAEYIRVKCPYCKKEYDIQTGQFKNGSKCNFCCHKYENSFAYHIEVELNLNINDVWDFEKNTINPYYMSKNYNGKVWLKCLNKKHDNYEVFCSNFAKGHRCKECGKEKRIKSRLETEKVKRKNNEAELRCLVEKEGYKYFECEMRRTTNRTEKFIKVQCPSSHEPYWVRMYDFKRGNRCVCCNITRGERKIMNWLDKNGIKYIYDQTYFKDLIGVGGGLLRPDFILPDYKIWIEFDGEQHYKVISDYFDFKTIQAHDKIKNEYAKENGYTMIRISYEDMEKIDKILEKNIKKEN